MILLPYARKSAACLFGHSLANLRLVKVNVTLDLAGEAKADKDGESRPVAVHTSDRVARMSMTLDANGSPALESKIAQSSISCFLPH